MIYFHVAQCFFLGKIKSGYMMLRALQKEGSFSFRDRSCSGKGDVIVRKFCFYQKLVMTI